MQIACGNCGGTVLVDVDLEKHVARCAACSAIFDTSGHHTSEVPLSPRRRAPVALPSSMRLMEGGRPLVQVPSEPYRSLQPMPPSTPSNDFSIERDWFTSNALIMPVVCVAWAWVGLHYRLIIQPTTCILVGAILLYGTLVAFLNRTTISVRGGALTIRHGPLPWAGNCTIPTADLAQIFCRQDVHTGRNGTTIDYSVHATLRSAPPVQLLSRLPEANQALFIEEVIETRLGIVDVPMAGELPG